MDVLKIVITNYFFDDYSNLILVNFQIKNKVYQIFKNRISSNYKYFSDNFYITNNMSPILFYDLIKSSKLSNKIINLISEEYSKNTIKISNHNIICISSKSSISSHNINCKKFYFDNDKFNELCFPIYNSMKIINAHTLNKSASLMSLNPILASIEYSYIYIMIFERIFELYDVEQSPESIKLFDKFSFLPDRAYFTRK